LLFQEIERARDWHASQGGIDYDQTRFWINEADKAHSQVKVLIYNGQLHITGEKQGVGDRSRVLKGLHMIYRAMVAVSDMHVFPNVEFTFDKMDKPNPEPVRPGRAAWAWTRRVEDNDTWVMPDYGSWSQVGDDIGAGYAVFRDRVYRQEKPWSKRTPKALWRGSLDVGTHVRPQLIAAAEGKDWADVGAAGKKGQVAIADHCDWKYLIHTEGMLLWVGSDSKQS
jgi:hypothetical protein